MRKRGMKRKIKRGKGNTDRKRGRFVGIGIKKVREGKKEGKEEKKLERKERKG